MEMRSNELGEATGTQDLANQNRWVQKLKNFYHSHQRKLLLVLFDALCFWLLDWIYYLLCGRVAYSIPVWNGWYYLINSLILFTVMFAARFWLSVYRSVWRYTSTWAYMRLVIADAAGGVIAMCIMRLLPTYQGIWHAVTLASLTALLTLCSRFAYRMLHKRAQECSMDQRIRVSIVGAGQQGVDLMHDLRNNRFSQYLPVCFVDVDDDKVGKLIGGLPICDESNLPLLQERYRVQKFILANTSLDNLQRKQLYERYVEAGCSMLIYTSPLLEDGVEKKRIIREFRIEDLLFRDPLTVNNRESLSYYEGKTVLVTGGGGSIGSELCRQLAICKPARLVIFDIYENNAYDIQQELKRRYGDALDLWVEIGSVRDRARLENLFATYRPDVVFHAAAHKHVPLMEQSGGEAIKNNVLGTYNTADMAEKYGAQKFILISTDKAVNPTNIMGASKRLCEMVIQCRTDSQTSFAAVRFGNVLGSNGSVIPLFKRQIESGGPVTVTDKRIIRYFMTIPEASQLVMQAGAMAKKGELFVLDMGKPVRIYDLAVNMIRLSGLRPEEDIAITEIGLRPGEKLYEELLMKTEDLDRTENQMIFVERDEPLSRELVDEKLELLSRVVKLAEKTGNLAAIKEAVIATVPTFHEPEELNGQADSTEEMKAANQREHEPAAV